VREFGARAFPELRRLYGYRRHAALASPPSGRRARPRGGGRLAVVPGRRRCQPSRAA